MQCNPRVFGYDVTYTDPDALIWGLRLLLIRWMCLPMVFKQLRNPIAGIVPIVLALAPSIRSTLNYLWNRSFHCDETGKQHWNLLLTVQSKLTTSVILLVHFP